LKYANLTPAGEDDIPAMEELKDNKDKPRITTRYKYNLGEEVKNGILFFGQEKTIRSRKTAMCVCPFCNELWRVDLSRIHSGKVKDCGCVKK
jgi:hypothetical protein